MPPGTDGTDCGCTALFGRGAIANQRCQLRSDYLKRLGRRLEEDDEAIEAGVAVEVGAHAMPGADVEAGAMGGMHRGSAGRGLLAITTKAQLDEDDTGDDDEADGSAAATGVWGGARRLLKGGSLSSGGGRGSYSSVGGRRWGNAQGRMRTRHSSYTSSFAGGHSHSSGYYSSPYYYRSYYYGPRAMRRYQALLVVRASVYLTYCYSCYSSVRAYYYDDRGRRCYGHLDCRTAVTELLPVEHDRYELISTVQMPPRGWSKPGYGPPEVEKLSQWPLRLIIHSATVTAAPMGGGPSAAFVADGGLGAGGGDMRSLPLFVGLTTDDNDPWYLVMTWCSFIGFFMFFAMTMIPICIL